MKGGKYSGPPSPDPFFIPDWVMVILIVASFFFLLDFIRRQRAIRFRILRIVIVPGSGFGIIFPLIFGGENKLIAILFGIMAMTIIDFLLFPAQKKSANIPKSEREKVIAAFESRRGKKFDPKRHVIECIIPVSDGGKPTADNLRVLRKRDRSKSHWWESLD
jgi:hypothetical protein